MLLREDPTTSQSSPTGFKRIIISYKSLYKMYLRPINILLVSGYSLFRLCTSVASRTALTVENVPNDIDLETPRVHPD